MEQSCVHDSFESRGVRHWIRFIEIVYGKDAADKEAFPPKFADVLAWSNTFRRALESTPVCHNEIGCRCFGTFSNYLGYLRSCCLALGWEPPPTGNPAIRRAMIAIAKREMFSAREKMFISG